MRKTVLHLLAGLTALLALTACNTVQGVGQDIQAGGRAIERAAR
ncbi:entericidin A/B family lipoprotein [Corticibacter populi]|uniref:Entericidin A/B family lipoprotein n=1 Tax=Corticibacter populi TaxID=1550736 RepID=A0A3M6R0F7_9BURK|nr:entericidin A/B family lipoprotein [Corticibacter populi]RMX08730.1 entericidin A/B family lipoprotein [Corticibacter populi]RZS36080.1 entericidin B [Corticibacter populi]